jgi:hypothetical protein
MIFRALRWWLWTRWRTPPETREKIWETYHLVQMGRWTEDMEKWIRQHPDATEAERLSEARKLVERYGLG